MKLCHCGTPLKALIEMRDLALTGVSMVPGGLELEGHGYEHRRWYCLGCHTTTDLDPLEEPLWEATRANQLPATPAMQGVRGDP